MKAVKKLSWLFLSLLSWGFADPDPYALYELPNALASQQGEVVSVRYGGEAFSYVPGIGWSPGGGGDAPVVRGEEVFVTGATVEALGLALTPHRGGAREPGGGGADCV